MCPTLNYLLNVFIDVLIKCVFLKKLSQAQPVKLRLKTFKKNKMCVFLNQRTAVITRSCIYFSRETTTLSVTGTSSAVGFVICVRGGSERGSEGGGGGGR